MLISIYSKVIVADSIVEVVFLHPIFHVLVGAPQVYRVTLLEHVH